MLGIKIYCAYNYLERGLATEACKTWVIYVCSVVKATHSVAPKQCCNDSPRSAFQLCSMGRQEIETNFHDWKYSIL